LCVLCMVLNQAREDIVKILNKAGVKATPADIVFPPNAAMGDFSLPLFALAKEKKIAPGALAQKLQHKLQPQGLVERVEIAGPYVNFWLRRDDVAKVVFTLTPTLSHRGRGSNRQSPSTRGRGQGRGNQRVMMEMVSPNNNKPLHLGHLRNAFLGESVARLLESQGSKIVRACLFNDRGLQIAKAMLAYKLWGKDKTPKSEGMKGDQFVVQWYVLFERKAKEERAGLSPEKSKGLALEKQAEELVRKWEAGDKETLALWKQMSGWALDGINETLKRLGIKFNATYFESQLWKQGKKVVEQGLKKGVFKKDETGAVLIEFPVAAGLQPALPPKILQRADGTAIYATADLALGSEKFRKYKLSRSIWCVGQEQDLYFKQLFAIYQMLGYKWANQCEHMTYGHVFLPEGKMKTREGTVVEADALLDHMLGLIKEEVRTRHDHLNEKEIEDRAEIIAQAAVRYYLLKVAPKTAVHFDPKASIAFTGDTGPYLLYTYARIASILRKAGSNSPQPPLKIRGGEGGVMRGEGMSNLEWHLIFQLARFPEIITQAAQDRGPSHLAQYLYKLAQQFSDFYENSPVLKSAKPTRAFRLALISAIQKTLKQGLHLLTIETVEEM